LERRLGAQATRLGDLRLALGDQRLAFGPTAQGQREPAGDQGQNQHPGQAREQPPQAPAGASLALSAPAGVGHLLFGRGAACLQEGVL
jgi:hypothetical protein